jgi:ABC-type oligopeptide transport system substrate-binding subunit
MLREAEELLLAAVPIIPILHNSTAQLIKPYVAGIHPNPIDVYSWAGVHIRRDWQLP